MIFFGNILRIIMLFCRIRRISRKNNDVFFENKNKDKNNDDLTRVYGEGRI